MSDGSEILAELRSVVATLEQSAYLQLIIPGARSFIDWYDGLLKGSDSAFGILIGYSEAQIFNIKKSLLSIQGNPPEDIAQAWKHLVESSFRYEMDENRRYHIPPDVWQLFIRKREIETALQLLNSGDVEPLKGVISETFGYEIRLAEGDNWSQWEDELLNLLTANLQIAAFFQEMLGSNSGLSGLDIVHQFFAQNPDGNPIEILLGGADQYMGRVPLPQSTSDLDELRRVRFGSDVSVATIVHEFGHQFDRWFQLLEDERYGGAGGVTEYFNKNLNRETRIPFNVQIYTHVLEGFAGKEITANEIFADIFMTSVLHNQGFKVLSLELHPHHLDVLTKHGYSTDFIKCVDGKAVIPLNVPIENGEGELEQVLVVNCNPIDVEWSGTKNADAVRDYVVGGDSSSTFLLFLQEINQ